MLTGAEFKFLRLEQELSSNPTLFDKCHYRATSEKANFPMAILKSDMRLEATDSDDPLFWTPKFQSSPVVQKFLSSSPGVLKRCFIPTHSS